MCETIFSYDQETYLCFYQEAAKLMEGLDKKIKEFIKDLKYEEVYIPSLIKGDILEKCGYFESFPQNLSVVCSLKKCGREKINRKEIGCENINIHDYYLTPAACIHIYPMLEKRRGTDICYTTRESVYRYENGEFKNPERLWQFTVREFVFVGTEEYVCKMLQVMEEKALEFARSLFGKAVVKNAYDEFYPSAENRMKIKLQLANKLKRELIVGLDNRNIALSSFNYHRNHFSKPFHFDDGGKIVTGCVGFGLERWVLCCLEHNIDII